MAAKTISFPKGKGHLTHNNRDFICNNVVPERTAWNRIYIQESLRDAYEKCFGQSLRDYNAAQKRKDRQKEDYLKEIENSGNKEKSFYENIVQIGKKTDTPVVGENGMLTEDAKAAIEVLDRYAKTFQERNPNLYLFNCVMHLDEATPHLHIDYIPVAHGYKNGMKTRNSLTKAFQQMGFAKAVSRKQNETVAWQEREREYLTELCREQGIEIEVIGVQRDNLSLPEYKAAMREVEELEQQAVVLDKRNEALEQKTAELRGQVQEMEVQNNELVLQAQKLTEQIEEAEEKEKAAKEVLAKHDLRAEIFKMISKEVAAETKNMKSVAVPVTNLFGSEEYVKVKKSDWNKMLDAFSKAVSRNYLLEKYEKKISGLEKKIAVLTDQVEKLKRFVASRGLGEAFVEFIKSLAPKTMKQKLEEAKEDAAVHNQQRKCSQQDIVRKNKQWQQEM
ncbi:MAG: plasmid recombination protein [Lachnospiraceae bacterium]|nr:plasmid recombination protein [Lachnospiraceae bacterium]